MNAFEIPLSPTPQTFLIELVGVLYRFTLKWCGASACWVLDITTPTDLPVILGIPIITGDNLLKQYDYLGIAGELRVQSLGDPDQIPTFESLGSDGILFFITP